MRKTKSSPPRSKTDSETGKKPKKGARKKSTSPESSETTTTGKRVGTKRSDRRWQAPDGTIWASKFEYQVYDALIRHFAGNPRVSVERCGSDCSLGYHSSVKNGRCLECGTVCVVQERTYTPDIRIVRTSESGKQRHTYIEAKGYFEGSKRSLFRQVLKAHKGVDIRLVAERDHWVTKGKTKLSDWAKRFKVKFHLWDKGKLLETEEWL